MARKKSNDTIYDASLDIRKTDKHSGIYKITNNLSQKVYIGQSINVFRRINTHRTSLRRGVHGNSHLQLSWNKYGEDAFTFEVVQFCEESDLNKEEFKWIGLFNSANKLYGYNSMIPDPQAKKFRHSEKTVNFLINRVDFTKDELICFLQEFFYMEGRIIDPKDKSNPKLQGYPKIHHFVTAFGNYGTALELAGLSQYDHKAKLRNKIPYTKERVIEQYQKFIDEHGFFPGREAQNTKIYDLPTHYVIKKIFGNVANLRAELGFDHSKRIEEEKEEAIMGLKKLVQISTYVTQAMITKSPLTKSINYYNKHFGNIYHALESVGLNIEENKRKILLNNKL